jgi:MoxR-like ATPase
MDSHAAHASPRSGSDLHDTVAGLTERLLQSVSRAVVGQRDVLEQLLVAILCRGHVLLEGVPGLAKTLMVRSLARALSLDFGRIQFTPDLMPADITGNDVLDASSDGGRRHRFVAGPIFCQLLLADEINRSPPKTQSALLEAMQEGQVTVGGVTHPLPRPFLVLATQNPIEQAGTYPLPEGQLDRFLAMIRVDYPNPTDELEIVRRTTGSEPGEATPVVSGEELARASALVRAMPMADHVMQACVDLARATRPHEGSSTGWIAGMVEWGAGPRASQSLALAAKAGALLAGKPCVEIADVVAVAHPVLRHRLVLSFEARGEGVTADAIIDRLLSELRPRWHPLA